MTKAKKTSTKKTTAKPAETSPEAPTMEAMEALAARIAELEGENEVLKSVKPTDAPQAVDTVRKNATEKLVRVTRGGNVRTDIDPSLELVAEAAAQDAS